ncbi:uncharacterized protein LOC129723645 [Wyeomyia smithii]|uniref:uncharacterized protein LOC129723645 n=1 Tax=Wyeomyia smithii TaxID=174621 RepID=UPI00246822D5|nr:uncharacterized protein LOC129723645 [Wyeomyia smithii]
MKSFKIILPILALLLLVQAKTIKLDELGQIETKIIAVKNIAIFQANNPEANIIPLDDVRQAFIYRLGARHAGDRLVATNGQNITWPTLRDVTLTLDYPKNGVGAYVTYLQINVVQSSSLGKAYIVRGGIGQRFVSVIVEAYSTSFFNYTAMIYGI